MSFLTLAKSMDGHIILPGWAIVQASLNEVYKRYYPKPWEIIILIDASVNILNEMIVYLFVGFTHQV